jgi:uncharacterized protein YbaP (TraB family)
MNITPNTCTLLASSLFVTLLTGMPAVALECPATPSGETATPTTDAPFGNGVFFRVSKENVPASHILGTIHVSDPRVIEKVSGARQLVGQSDQLLLELDLSNETMEIITRASFYADDTTLDQVVGVELAHASVELLREHGIPPEIAMRMQPWAVFSSLAMPPETGIPLDMQILSQARGAGIDVSGIETPEEQIAALSALAEDEHAMVLLSTVCEYERWQGLLDEMIELYLDSDLAGLAAISEQPVDPSVQPLMDKLNEALLVNRNAVMVERMLPMLELGNQYVAIGALHLVGETGILNQLAARGYTIETLE